MFDLSLFAAMIGGLLAFFSPCFLPILPTFLGYLSGLSLSSKYAKLHPNETRIKLLVHTAVFALGFSTILLMLGGAIGYAGLLIRNQALLQTLGGFLIIGLGLHTIGLFGLQPFKKTFQFRLPKSLEKLDYLKSLLFGATFSIAWVPCTGPIIGSIFTLVALEGGLHRGILLFIFYSIGFTTPLLISSLFINQIKNGLKNLSAHWLKTFAWISGSFIILIGLLILTSDLGLLYEWTLKIYDKIGIEP